jgi:hypothetical protein
MRTTTEELTTNRGRVVEVAADGTLTPGGVLP